MKRVITIFLATLIGFATLPPAFAQDKTEVRIELKDGKAYLNGKLIEPDGREKVTVETEDGDTVIVHFSEDGTAVWAGTEATSRFPRGLAFSSGSNEFVFDNDMPRLLREYVGGRDGAGSTFFFDGDASDSDIALFREGGSPFFRSRQADRETMAIEREIKQKVSELHRADGAADKSRLESELDELLERAFDAKLQVQREEAEKLASRLAELRERLDQRAEARREIIERRKSEILGRRDVLDW